jgi:hypothetical protein
VDQAAGRRRRRRAVSRVVRRAPPPPVAQGAPAGRTRIRRVEAGAEAKAKAIRNQELGRGSPVVVTVVVVL